MLDMLDVKRNLAILFTLLSLTACSSGEEANRGSKSGKPEHLVELALVSRDAMSYTSARAGSLRAVREVKLVNLEEGRVMALNAREGDKVERDQVLLELDDRVLRAELAKAEANLRQAKLNAQRLKQLKAKQLVSEDAATRAQTEQDVARAEVRLLRTRLDFMTIKAPFDAEVAARFVEVGDVAPKNTHLLSLVDSSELVTDVQVSELLLPFLKVDDKAQVRIDALGDQVFDGVILRIYPKIDAATRLGRIEVSLKPVPQGARAGQFCRVTLSSGDQEHLVIPFTALRRDSRGEYVFIYGDDAKVKRTSVKSGLHLADKVEIREGLEQGQRVVAKGFLGLSDGQQVKPVTQGETQVEQPASMAAGAQDA